MRSSMPPYERIAMDIRRQIERGELAVGERVPSTRDLACKWKVATATAAHALKTLAQEGVVRGVPRVGTIVASTRPRFRHGERKDDDVLTTARIVEAAIAIADAEGLPLLSLRGVASTVGAPVMSLYRHVHSKDDLIRLMTDAALGEESLPSSPPLGWRAQLEMGARAEWRVFRRHPWLARVMNITRPEPLPNAIAYADWMFRALGTTNVDATTKMRVHIILHGFVQGIAVNVEAEADAASDSGLSDDEWMHGRSAAYAAVASSGAYPSFAKVLGDLADGFEIDFDALFENGLAALLDGFTPLLEPRRKRK